MIEFSGPAEKNYNQIFLLNGVPIAIKITFNCIKVYLYDTFHGSNSFS